MKAHWFFRSAVLSLLIGFTFNYPPVSARAGEMTLPVISTNSTLLVTLCADPGAGLDCDTDTANLVGAVVIALDNDRVPGELSLRDFDLQASRALNLNLSWVFGLATLHVTVTNLGVARASPGPLNPYYPVSSGAFTGTNVPYQLQGIANYTASGLACTVLQGQGYPCNGALDFSTNGPGTVAAMPGTILVSNGMVHLHFEIALTNYLDDANPSLGTVAMIGVVNAAAPFLAIERSGGGLALRWPSQASGYKPYQVHSLTPPIGWELVPGPWNDDGTWRTIDLPQGTNTFYGLGL